MSNDVSLKPDEIAWNPLYFKVRFTLVDVLEPVEFRLRLGQYRTLDGQGMLYEQFRANLATHFGDDYELTVSMRMKNIGTDLNFKLTIADKIITSGTIWVGYAVRIKLLSWKNFSQKPSLDGSTPMLCEFPLRRTENGIDGKATVEIYDVEW